MSKPTREGSESEPHRRPFYFFLTLGLVLGVSAGLVHFFLAPGLPPLGNTGEGVEDLVAEYERLSTGYKIAQAIVAGLTVFVSVFAIATTWIPVDKRWQKVALTVLLILLALTVLLPFVF